MCPKPRCDEWPYPAASATVTMTTRLAAARLLSGGWEGGIVVSRGVGVAMALLLVLSACGGNDDESTTDGPASSGIEDATTDASSIPDGPTTPEEPAATRESGPVVPESGEDVGSSEENAVADEREDRWASTPLAHYWGSPSLSEAEWWVREEQLIRQEEELIAACMAEQGFEYIPWVWISPLVTRQSQPELSAAEYRERYGYGVSTFIGDVPDVIDLEVEAPVNANEAIQDAMSPAELQAFRRAMRGSGTISEETPLEDQGCTGLAIKAVQGVGRELREELGDDREALRERIENDPRVVQATLEWSRCMTQAGFAFASTDAIRDELAARSEPFQMRGDLYEVLSPAEIDALTQDERVALQRELATLSPEEQAELDALQQFELDVAAADHECAGPLDDVRYEVTVELEQGFVDEHLAQLEAIVAARGT